MKSGDRRLVILPVVLILTAAMFASNFGSGVTGNTLFVGGEPGSSGASNFRSGGEPEMAMEVEDVCPNPTSSYTAKYTLFYCKCNNGQYYEVPAKNSKCPGNCDSPQQFYGYAGLCNVATALVLPPSPCGDCKQNTPCVDMGTISSNGGDSLECTVTSTRNCVAPEACQSD